MSMIIRSTKDPKYDLLLYVFHVNFGHNMQKIQLTKNSIIFYLTFKAHPRSKIKRSTDIPYMTYYMCFI